MDDIDVRVIQGNFGGAPFRECGELAERLHTLIYEYDGRLSLAAVLGTLRIVEQQVYARAVSNNDE